MTSPAARPGAAGTATTVLVGKIVIAWNTADLEKIGAAEELDLRSERADATLRAPVTMWAVRVGAHVYVRSVKGTAGPWYRGTQTRRRGLVEAGGVRQQVAFHQADPGEYPDVDAAYRAKYGRYPGIVEHVLTDQARASTPAPGARPAPLSARVRERRAAVWSLRSSPSAICTVRSCADASHPAVWSQRRPC